LGSAGAATRLGKGVQYLQTVQVLNFPCTIPGFHPGLHGPTRLNPTPARHVKGGLGIVDFRSPNEVKYSYEGRGELDTANYLSHRSHECFRRRVCLADSPCRRVPCRGSLQPQRAGTSGKRCSQDGQTDHEHEARLQLREGQSLPMACSRTMCRRTPLTDGPLKGVTIDHRKLAASFFESIGWNKETLVPTQESLKDLGGMDDVGTGPVSVGQRSGLWTERTLQG